MNKFKIFMLIFAANALAQGTAQLPFKVNVNATVKLQQGTRIIEENVTANTPYTFTISEATPIRPGSEIPKPTIYGSRGRLALGLPSLYNGAEIALYSLSGKRVMHGRADAAKSISHPNMATGVYLLHVKGSSSTFSTRLTHQGGGMSIDVAFGDAKVAPLKKEELGTWNITVSSATYLDSAYSLAIDAGSNTMQVITLKPSDNPIAKMMRKVKPSDYLSGTAFGASGGMGPSLGKKSALAKIIIPSEIQEAEADEQNYCGISGRILSLDSEYEEIAGIYEYAMQVIEYFDNLDDPDAEHIVHLFGDGEVEYNFEFDETESAIKMTFTQDYTNGTLTQTSVTILTMAKEGPMLIKGYSRKTSSNSVAISEASGWERTVVFARSDNVYEIATNFVVPNGEFSQAQKLYAKIDSSGGSTQAILVAYVDQQSKYLTKSRLSSQDGYTTSLRWAHNELYDDTTMAFGVYTDFPRKYVLSGLIDWFGGAERLDYYIPLYMLEGFTEINTEGRDVTITGDDQIYTLPYGININSMEYAGKINVPANGDCYYGAADEIDLDELRITKEEYDENGLPQPFVFKDAAYTDLFTRVVDETRNNFADVVEGYNAEFIDDFITNFSVD